MFATRALVKRIIVLDLLVLEPTDAAILLKILGYSALYATAVIIDYYEAKKVREIILDAIIVASQNNEPSGHLEGKDKENRGQIADPPGEYPGDDPTKAPDGYEWKGKPGSQPGDKNGSYHNPNTGEALSPDLNHPKGIEPHWDYKSPDGNHWRWFPGE